MKIRLLFSFITLVLFCSCTKPERNNTRERYVVTSRNLNIRSDPSKLSRAIGSLSRGDTIVALASDKYWIMIRNGNQTGFISNEFMKKIEPYPTPFPFSFIDHNSDWHSWRFWAITMLFLALWTLSAIGISRYENYLRKENGIKIKNLSISPIVFFVAGILTGVLYLFWKDQLIESIYHKFSFNPIGKEAILMVLLGQGIFVLTGLIIDLIGNLIKSGRYYGSILFLLYLLENMIIFFTTLYFTISVFLLAIIVLTIFFAIQYIALASQKDSSLTDILQ